LELGQGGEKEVADLAGLGDATGAGASADAFLGEIGAVDGEVAPPGAVLFQR